MLRTSRLHLRNWQEAHRSRFAALHTDEQVMADQGGPLTPAESDAKFERYRASLEENGVTRWAVEDLHGRFLGYCGVMRRADPSHPLGAHLEVGWRLTRAAWGNGYAAESATAALLHAFAALSANEILSYTSETNHRSQAVMERLALRRDPSRDFKADYVRVGEWRGQVWVADRPLNV